MDIIKINKALIDDTARLHKENFTDEHNLHYFSKDLLKEYFHMFLEKEGIYFYGINNNRNLIAVLLGGNSKILNEVRNNFIKNYKKSILKELILNSLKNPKLIYKTLYERVILRFINYSDIKENINLDGNSLNILSIVVDKNFRGKGIGKLLIKEFEDIAKKQNKSFITLSVRKSNKTAIQFYKKLGFKIYKETKIGLYLYKKI